jgi:type VI secretion system secreted protein VgrG
MTNVGLMRMDTVGMNWTMNVGKKFAINAGEEILLDVAGNTVKITADGISLNGKKITETAEGDVIVNAKNIHLN